MWVQAKNGQIHYNLRVALKDNSKEKSFYFIF